MLLQLHRFPLTAYILLKSVFVMPIVLPIQLAIFGVQLLIFLIHRQHQAVGLVIDHIFINQSSKIISFYFLTHFDWFPMINLLAKHELLGWRLIAHVQIKMLQIILSYVFIKVLDMSLSIIIG